MLGSLGTLHHAGRYLMDSTSPRDVEIAIIGAGIIGLASALHLT